MNEKIQNKRNLVSLALVLAGLFQCTFYLILGKTELLWSVAAAAAISLIFYIMQEKGAVKKIFPVLFLLFLMVCWGQKEIWLEGFKGCCNQVGTFISDYYGTDMPKFSWSRREEDIRWFLYTAFVTAGCAEGLLYQSERKRGRALLRMLLPGMVLMAGLLIGKAPSPAGMGFLMGGILIGQLEIKGKGTVFGITAMGALFLAAAVFAQSARGEQFLEKRHDGWQRKQWETEEKIWSAFQNFNWGKKDSSQEEMVLGNEKPDQEGRQMFRITLEEQPKEAVYLKGFVGGTYQDGRWEAASKEAFAAYGEERGIKPEEFAELVWNRPYAMMEEAGGGGWMSTEDGADMVIRWENEGVASKQVRIEPVSRKLGYTLIPYFTRITDEFRMEGDGVVEALEENTPYTCETFLNLFPAQSEGTGQQSMVRISDWNRNGAYGTYEAYVETQYLQVPEGMDWLQRFVNQGQLMQDNWVQSLLWKDTAYSKVLKPLPEGAEFVAYFLLEQKKGYCVHYATAATLMLRMWGIPSRYVAGYRVLPSDFHENEDGTFTAEVTDYRAHAWTEVFQSEYGFYPMEVTPAQSTRQESQPEKPKDIPSQKEAEKPKTQTEAPKAEKDLEKNPGSGSKGEAWFTSREAAAIMPGAAVLAVLAGITAGFYLRRRRYLKRYHHLLEQGTHTARILETGKEIFRMLELAGQKKPGNMPEQEYAGKLQQTFVVSGERSWENLIALLQKAAFSGRELSEEEYRMAARMYGEVKEKLEKEMIKGRWSRIYWKYIRLLP